MSKLPMLKEKNAGSIQLCASAFGTQSGMRNKAREICNSLMEKRNNGDNNGRLKSGETTVAINAENER
jgi:hypothetical protein